MTQLPPISPSESIPKVSRELIDGLPRFFREAADRLERAGLILIEG